MGDRKFANLLSAASELASSGMRRAEKRNSISGRPSTNHRERPGHVSAIYLTYIFVLSTQVSFFNRA